MDVRRKKRVLLVIWTTGVDGALVADNDSGDGNFMHIKGKITQFVKRKGQELKEVCLILRQP